MADLISRAAAIKVFTGKPPEYYYTSYIIDELNCVPAVDAVLVVHARWQGVSPFVDTEECSNCRYNIQSEELETPYCPWCGAKMDGERRDDDAAD